MSVYRTIGPLGFFLTADDGRDSDAESGLDVEEYSGMEQPPLIKQLKTILAEYPDDGQIIKVSLTILQTVKIVNEIKVE